MESPKNGLIWGFLIAGLALIGLSLYFGQKTTSPLIPEQSVLAHAELLTGTAFVIRNGGLQKDLLTHRASLGHLDSIETGDLGEVRLDFTNQDKVRIKEHSLVTLEKVEDQQNFHRVLILKHGNFEIESLGRDGDLFIAKNGERISATDYQESPLAQATTQDVPSSASMAPIATDTTLSEQEIQQVMNSHRTSFLKCYTQLLQKDANARGDATLSFTVEPNGKISSVDVTSASLKQSDFKRCLVEVTSRVEFRPFRGTPVSTLFPLQFE